MTNFGKPCWRFEILLTYLVRVLQNCCLIEHSMIPGPATLDNETKAKILDLKKKEKDTYDQHATLLPSLQPGTRIAIRSLVDSNWSLLGTITEIRPNRSYTVLTNQGSTLTRNRRYLRPAPLTNLLRLTDRT